MTRQRLQKGFTLVEILIASVMITLIMSIAYTGYFSITNSTKRCNYKLYSLDQNRTLLTALARQISCSYESSITDADNAEKINYFNTENNAIDNHILNFVTTRAAFAETHRDPGLWNLTYRLDEKKGILYIDKKNFVPESKTAGDKRDWLKVADNVEYLRLEFFNGEEWTAEWNYKERGKLPAAVRIKLGIKDGNEQVYNCQTAVNVASFGKDFGSNSLYSVEDKL